MPRRRRVSPSRRPPVVQLDSPEQPAARTAARVRHAAELLHVLRGGLLGRGAGDEVGMASPRSAASAAGAGSDVRKVWCSSASHRPPGGEQLTAAEHGGTRYAPASALPQKAGGLAPRPYGEEGPVDAPGEDLVEHEQRAVTASQCR